MKHVSRSVRVELLIAASLSVVLLASCENSTDTPQPSRNAPAAQTDSPAALSQELTREGFKALGMSSEERDALAAAVEASQWTELSASVFPERIRRFDGVHARIEGWMIPGRIKQRRVLDFMLVRDNAACCFGAMPGADEWIHVEMNEGASAEYVRYAKIAVEGVLTVGGAAVVEGMQPPALRLRASSCELIEKPR